MKTSIVTAFSAAAAICLNSSSLAQVPSVSPNLKPAANPSRVAAKPLTRAKLPAEQLRKSRTIGRGSKTRAELTVLGKGQINYDPILTGIASPDMAGWTAVTAGGATAAPEIVNQSKPYLIVRGKDKVTYAAPVNLATPAPIESGVWQVLDQNIEQVRCATQGDATDCMATAADGSNKGFSVYVDAPDKPGLSRTKDVPFPTRIKSPAAFVAFALDNEKWEVVSGFSAWNGSQALQISGYASYFAVDDDGDQYLESYARDWKPTTKAFYAYAPQSDCAQSPDMVMFSSAPSYCVIGDGIGDKLSLFRTNGDDLAFELTKVTDLPAVPGGGGMSKGETAIAQAGKVLYVFARGKDGKLYLSTGEAGGTAFSNWTSQGGFVKEGSAPSCDVFQSGVTCAIRSADNRIYMRRIPAAKTSSGL